MAVTYVDSSVKSSRNPLRDSRDRRLKASVQTYCRTPFDEAVWNQLSEGICFVQGEFDDDDAFERLSEVIEKLDDERGTHRNQAFYLSLPPKALEQVCRQLSKHGLAQGDGDKWRRAVIEKSFGHDLESARALNDIVESVFPPDSVFRIDHYLGKETVQNVLALRFANQLFELLWNANYVDHVQITMAEDVGTGGRAGYYDGVGAARDVIQNHLLQLLALTAIEEPISFNAEDPRAEKQKGAGSRQAVGGPFHTLGTGTVCRRLAGWRASARIPGRGRHPCRLDHGDVCRHSAGHQHAPLVGRAVLPPGRQAAGPPRHRDRRRVQAGANLLFADDSDNDFGQNAAVIRVQPDEGGPIRFGSKVPGTQMEVRDVIMDFEYGHAFAESSPEAYERLILDVPLGEPPLVPAPPGG